MIIISWVISIGYMTFIILMAFADPSMEIVGALYLANKSTANLIIYITILTTLMVILTAFFDWRITVTNSRIQELRRQIVMTFGLILVAYPVSYYCIYSIITIVSIIKTP
uniref:Uncharacterized protein n=1 Tax=Meloidogyne enterolobii TaxID=390850 RepID=A0A6V7W0Y2_MELEN|nr:unnamed protein product [Meloidogyne enterolobii]